jgi:hypothetical protein
MVLGLAKKKKNLLLVADDDWCLSTKPQVKERESIAT